MLPAPAMRFAFFLLLAASLAGCGSDSEPASSSGTSASSSSSASSGSSSSGSGGGSSASSSGAGGQVSSLEAILAELRADRDAALTEHGNAEGWPVLVEDGRLFVSVDPALDELAGDHDAWMGAKMNDDMGFRWLVVAVDAGDKYKFKGGMTFAADAWSRAYAYDDFGEISVVAPAGAHLERLFGIGDAAMQARTVRVWVPASPATRVLYVHDGQNLFDPSAAWGSWKLAEAAPDAMLLVGIDNTAARMDEYTHVADDIGGGQIVGGKGDAYADYLESTVRPLVGRTYGEPAVVGVMGSSLGGLISFHVADRHPGHYAFAASLSGTMGWGSIGLHNQTMIERYSAHGHQATSLYLDSGGDGNCVDSDGDGILDDDAGASDNYCENEQLHETLLGLGYADGGDLHYVWQPGAMHNEAAWAARVGVTLQLFAGL